MENANPRIPVRLVVVLPRRKVLSAFTKDSVGIVPRPSSNKIVRSGENLAPTFMDDFPQPGALPVVLDGQVIGAMGVSSGDGEKCAHAAIDSVFKGQATTVGR